MRTTSTPARARRAPRKPPIAPAPSTTSFTPLSGPPPDGGRALWLSSRAREVFGDEPALDLAGRRARDRLDEVQPLGHLEVGQPLTGVGQQLLLSRGRGQDDSRRDLLAPRWMRDSKGDGLLHRRVALEHLVDLARRDLFAAAVDELFDAADEAQVAGAVERALVAGAKPPVYKRVGVRLRVVLVPVHHIPPPDDDLAGSAGRKGRAI